VTSFHYENQSFYTHKCIVGMIVMTCKIYHQAVNLFPKMILKCRFLDKAALIVPTQTVEHQEQSRWKLCRVTEVEETKIFIRMIPMWVTFTMCGVVSSIGETYFLEQANHMNRKVGKLKVPLTMLPIFYKIAKSTLAKLYVEVAEKFTEKGSGKYVAPVGNIAAMLFSILCCITAAKMETMRLEVIKNHMLLDKPNHKIPMSMFWLLPQFLFLGALDGISGKSIPDFFTSQVPASMRPLMEIFTWVAFGAGTMGSVLSVHVVGKVSERGGKPSWFQDTLNESHLNNYYWVLTIWSSINLVLYILVAIWYPYQDPPRDRVDLNQVELL
jgi:peptide/histidine transporter 3/4